MSDETPSPRDLLEYLARGLVDEPDHVKVKEVREDDGSVILELSAAQDDYGGRTASALRTVVKSAAVRHGQRVFVDIVD